ncbi:tellurite resistance TerB C-terminal domain-containing protein [Snodgrassella communis]|uniref:tellurite resistance TerB C-terminal domain-containing protein n=1 Tax=Snodgrassella communis TaxID=2946699 RepID=UPI003B969176
MIPVQLHNAVKSTRIRNKHIEPCKRFNLLSDCAIESTNEWAYDYVDALLIKDNNDIYIDFKILIKLH